MTAFAEFVPVYTYLITFVHLIYGGSIDCGNFLIAGGTCNDKEVLCTEGEPCTIDCPAASCYRASLNCPKDQQCEINFSGGGNLFTMINGAENSPLIVNANIISAFGRAIVRCPESALCVVNCLQLLSCQFNRIS